MDELYALKTNEFTYLSLGRNVDTLILKVPGGWIYNLASANGFAAVFVPYIAKDATN